MLQFYYRVCFNNALNKLYVLLQLNVEEMTDTDIELLLCNA